MLAKEEGIEQGINQKITETVKMMLEEGMSDDVILRIAKVSQEKLSNIKNSLKI